MSAVSHYEVLGVEAGASPADIRQAYVRLARRHHPDFYAGADDVERLAAERQMRALNEAWEVLGDRAKRRRYDLLLGLGPPSADDEDPGFRPFDTGDDDVDPRDLPDAPYRRDPVMESPVTRVLTLAPVVSFASSIGLLAVGVVVGSVAILGLAVAAFAVACLGFVVLPLVALSRARRDD